MPNLNFQYSLSEEPQKAKRNLMLFTSLIVFLAVTRELPENIPVLGIQLESSRNQIATVWSLLSVQVYLFFRFLVLISVDLRNWLANTAIEASQELGTEGEQQVRSPESQERFLKGYRTAQIFSKLSVMARPMELGIPVLYGVLGLAASYSLFFIPVTKS